MLHELLVKIGFVDWARQRTGFIFTALHGTKDPADMASKRMCRLYDKAAIDRDFYKMFHGLRHARINLDRELAIDPRTTRLQVGHELRDVHESYGGSHMQKRELLQVASVPLPEDIDFSVFNGLDFDGLAAARPRLGRPFKPKPYATACTTDQGSARSWWFPACSDSRSGKPDVPFAARLAERGLSGLEKAGANSGHRYTSSAADRTRHSADLCARPAGGRSGWKMRSSASMDVATSRVGI